MESFLVSARKYRPATFSSVVGQEHITQTLKNAIATHQLAHAFLFCGPRGVGKTTCARILAKTINCAHLTDQLEACDQCESCTSFNQSASINIFELDAASNNLVDDIRNLVNQVRIPPQSSPYKVYVIDEVHMLTSSAFNAFLKTLEEPPPYAKFILATTEKHKIIPTILSRCQIFDFKRIKTEDITKHLEFVAKQEGVNYELDALHLIAQKAEGGLRDSLSMFDQLVNFTSGNLTYPAVIQNLNILDYDYYFSLVDDFLQGDVYSSLLLFQEILEKGFDGQYFINGLASHFRNLLVCLDPATHRLLEVSENIRLRYGEQASNMDIEKLMMYLNIANDFDYRYKDVANKRLHIEVALMNLAQVATRKNQDAIPTVKEQAEKKNSSSEVVVSQEARLKTDGSSLEPQKIAQTIEAPEKKIVFPKAGSISLTQQQGLPSESKTENPIKAVEVGISVEQLRQNWNLFADERKDSNPDLYFAMKQSEVDLQKQNEVHYEVLNNLQQEELQKVKTELMSYLRACMHEEKLQLKMKVKTEEQKEAKPYTPRDKYIFFAEKNPAMNTLRAKLNLDIDF